MKLWEQAARAAGLDWERVRRQWERHPPVKRSGAALESWLASPEGQARLRELIRERGGEESR